MAGGMHPFGFRFTNIVLHGGVSALAVPVVNHLLGGKAPRLSFLTALLFAVHPIHTEAVSSQRSVTVKNQTSERAIFKS